MTTLPFLIALSTHLLVMLGVTGLLPKWVVRLAFPTDSGKSSMTTSLTTLGQSLTQWPVRSWLTLAFQCLAIYAQPCAAVDYGDPTPLEQAHLELINRARANPLLEAQRLAIDLFEGLSSGALANSNPVQPLSSNAVLLSIARSHSQDMLKNNYFAHNNLLGKSPFDRMTAAGYSYQAAGENLGWQGTTASLDETATAISLHNSLFIDKNVTGRGHRLNILSPNFKEVGVGLAFGRFSPSGNTYNAGLVTTDFGARNNKPLIVGVVYEDKNADQFYNAGEGIAAVSVAQAATNSTHTASAGGYALDVNANSQYTLIFMHPNYGSVTKTVQVAALNVKVDVLRSEFSGNTANNYAQCAVLVQNQLTVPCITLAGTPYSAALTQSNNAPVQFTLQSTAFSNLTATAQCATYNSQTNTAHLQCVSVGERHYWADLQLKDGVFQLGDYAEIP